MLVGGMLPRTSMEQKIAVPCSSGSTVNGQEINIMYCLSSLHSRAKRRNFAVIACLTILSSVLNCYGDIGADKPAININDYFQIPADLIEHFPLLHKSEELQQSTAFAHIVKDPLTNSWATKNFSTAIEIPTVSSKVSFSFHNSQTGTITNIQNTFQSVADTVYLEFLQSVLHVECDYNSTLTITYNTSLSPSSSGLKFGLKRGHFTEFTRVAGGEAFLCNQSCAMGSTISRRVLGVVSYAEDAETGYLSSITLKTALAPEEELFNTEADIFVNGSFALIPKANLQANRNSSRLNWHGYLKKAHDARESFRRRSAANLRSYDCGGDGSALQCDFGSIKTGFAAEIRYVKSNACFVSI
jgi:hypothetical protein